MGAISKLVNNNATNIAGGGNNNTVTVTNNNRLQLEEQTAKKSAVDLLPSTSSSLSSATPGNATSAIALTANGKPKEKRRNNEKRKERSRDAARCRRSRETEIFTELAQVLPLKKEDVQQLDKASVMRIAISYLKVRDMLKMFPKIQALCGDLDIPYSQEEHSEKYEKEENNTSTTNTPYDTENDDSQQSSAEEPKQENLETSKLSTEENASTTADDDSFNSTRFIKQTLDGFLLILSNDGDITYVTDNISDYLGISKIDMLGQQIWEYAHQCDHAELKEALNIKRNGVADKVKDEHLLEEGISTDHRDLFVRLKCTLTSRGRSINIKSASYKVIHITGHLVVNTKGDRVLVAMGRPIPHPSNIEVPLGSTTFLTKHSLDMKFVYADDKMFNLLGYKPEDLLETSLFNYHHGIDSDSLMVTFKNVLSKGQGETSRYRFLGKYGGYCWIVTQATIVYDKLKPQSVVCVNYVISNLENKHEIYTLQQYEESQKLKLVEDIKGSNNNNNNNTGCNNKNEILNINTKEIKSAPQQQKAEKLEDNKEHKIEIPLNNNGNNKNIANNSNKPPEITENSFNSIQIKREQTPPVVVTAAATPNPITPNNSNNNTIEPQKPILYKNYNNNPTDNNNPSLLPQPIAAATGTTTNLHCPTTTVTRTIFENNKPPASTVTRAIFENKSLSKYADDKGPKTVTSSILRPATSAVLQHGVSLPTTTSTQAILQLQPTTTATALNVNPLGGAQSVTASVFAPRSQHIPLTTTTASIFAKHHQQQQQQQQNPQQQQTEAVNQQDMNKGYLTFAEDASELTMLKEEPDDLTAHLVAPNAVDACLPLDETTPLFSEMLVGLMGTYGGLLSDDISSFDSSNSATSNTDHSNNNCNSSSGSCPSPFSNHNGTAVAATTHSQHHQQQHQQQHHRQSPTLTMTNSSITNGNSNSNHNHHHNNNNSNSPVTNNTTNSTNIDPFINNNRDESNDTLCSQHLLSSPSASSKSPDGSSLPSLCSPNSLSQEDDFSYYTMNVDDMDDLTMRAPYIPMNEQDDLPLLTTDDFMWSSGNAFNADDFSLQTKETDNLQALQSSINQNINYQQQQFTQPQQQQQQYSSSLCSSPASTVSSMSPSSPMQQQQQQHQQQQQQQIQQNNSQQFLTSDSSELAALLCGTGSGSLSLLQDNSTNSSIGNCGGAAGVLVSNGGGGGSIGSTDSGVMLTDDLDNVSVASASSSANNLTQQQQQHEFQQQCLQQLQDQLQQQQRQQQQLLLSGLNISCKKEKFDGSANNGTPVSLTPSLCDSIEDSFDSVYNKNSSNLDCWSDFLQINNATDNSNNNTATATTTPQHVTVTLENLRHEDCKQQIQMQLQQQQQQQQQQHQNIILNAVPLITIQSNNKNLIIPTTTQQSQQQSQNNSPNSLNSTQSNTKILNTKVNTIKLTPLTSTATIRIIENRQPLMQQQQQQQQNVVKTAFLHTTGGNKRHLSNSQLSNTSMDSKRMKGINAESTTTTSQLLQQLITTPQNGKQQQAKDSKAMMTNNHNTNSNKWSSQNSNVVMAENKQQQQQHQKQQRQQQQLSQQSNSVLKNLLISGCDKPQLQNTDILNNDESSMDQCLSPALAKPLKCLTNSATSSPTPNETGLLNYLNNPLICGPGVLPSPTLASMAVINDDSNPPGLTACPDIVEGANDSGIDDSIHENMSPLKRAYEGNDSTNQDKQQMKLNKNGLVMVAEVTPMAAVNQSSGGNDDDMGASICKRKRSISFLDSNNPLMATPFLMDLCNDDYVMSLGENYIDNVLNVWPEELA
ncbi:protein similar isoform X2 [Musca domestica]|uniref:Protein similar isoform X2 n=1 Tax=Musca domestica TaxID=7370 RepID=A0ABM3V0D7_MUSDO|nr:protein similar isoform X2 [Musca domestica]XP_058979247.1 protein similar isoform X2 [Musca domestica]XP_058979248.1 protein similar isoform X2 [Musca domestica]XP_058979256.1 protein similar isoform X2 [Musca domestica]XP_058979259.1 protein similar isoform X2 [Musca domestica]XP_058979260.1 protein similar isoform X2 [Musca domestica]XP_058979263.1 protein similar isoform X2 [Musca domestica]